MVKSEATLSSPTFLSMLLCHWTTSPFLNCWILHEPPYLLRTLPLSGSSRFFSSKEYSEIPRSSMNPPTLASLWFQFDYGEIRRVTGLWALASGRGFQFDYDEIRSLRTCSTPSFQFDYGEIRRRVGCQVTSRRSWSNRANVSPLTRKSSMRPRWSSNSTMMKSEVCPCWSLLMFQFDYDEIRSSKAGSGPSWTGEFQFDYDEIRSSKAGSGPSWTGEFQFDYGEIRSVTFSKLSVLEWITVSIRLWWHQKPLLAKSCQWRGRVPIRLWWNQKTRQYVKHMS